MKTERFLYLILAVVLMALLYNLSLWPITAGSEAQYAEISREMLRSGDYLHPRLLGLDHYQTPPLTYWLISLGMQLWGVNSFGARFFGQVALICQSILIYQIALRLLGNQRIALFAGMIYLSLPLVLLGSRQLTPAVFLTTFELAAIRCWLTYYLEQRLVALYGIAISLGLGFLTDGFQVLLLPCLVGLYVLIFGQQALYFPPRHTGLAALLGIAVGGFWYAYLGFEHDAFGEYFWQTYLPSLAPTIHWRLLLAGLLGSLPWLGLLVMSLLQPIVRLVQPQAGSPVHPFAGQLILFWLLLPGGVLVLTGQQRFDWLPILAGLAIILGYLTQQVARRDIHRCSTGWLQIYVLTGLLAVAVPLISQLAGEKLRITWPMTITALATIGISLLLFNLMRAGVRFRLVILSLAASLLLLLYGGYFVAANAFWVNTTQPLAQIIKARQLQNLPILVYNEALPSLAFELDQDMITIADGRVSPDLRFQTRRRWRDQWIQPDNPDSARYLRRLINRPSVLIVPGELPENWYWVRISYPNQVAVGRWQVFYRVRQP